MTSPPCVRGLVDLHVHTECSGDSYMPLYALVPGAERLGLAAIAKTDHDSVEGCAWLMEHAENSPVEYIPAVEMSTAEGFHVLGYYIDPTHPGLLVATAAEQEYGQRKLDETVSAWKTAGGNLPDDPSAFLEGIRDLRVGRQISMKQVIDHLVGQGLYSQQTDAFEDADEKLERFTPPPHTPPAAATVIQSITDAAGLDVIAHPSLKRVEEVSALLDAGAVGVEALNVKAVSPEARRFWGEYAQEHDIIVTGGTDWHGPIETWNILRPTIIPYTAVEGLRAAVQRLHGREV